MSEPKIEPKTDTTLIPVLPSRRHQVTAALAGPYRLVPVGVVLVIIWAFFATQSSTFLTPGNLSNLAMQIVVTATLATGLVFLLLIGEIDLSVANLSAVAGSLAAYMVVFMNVPMVPAILVALAFGALWGLMQGRIVTAFRVPAFLLTLATSLVLQGLLLTVLPPGNAQIPLFSTPLEFVANSRLTAASGWAIGVIGIVVFLLMRFDSYRESKRVGSSGSFAMKVLLPTVLVAVVILAAVWVLNSARGVPLVIVLLMILLTLLAVILKHTKFGVAIYAIGGNAEAAKRTGIKVTRVRLIAFSLTGLFAALAGIIAASRTLSVSNQSAEDTLLLQAIAAAVIGGTSLFGGRGSIWSALLGALVIGSIANGLYLMDAPTNVRLIVQGGVLALAICLDALLVRSSNNRGNA